MVRTMSRIRHLLRRKKSNRSLTGNLFVIFLLLAFAALMVVPLVYAVASAFKPFEEIFIFPPKLYVINPTWENFQDLFRIFADSTVPFIRYVFNSVVVSVACTLMHIFFASMAAYPLAKIEFRGKRVLMELVMLALLFVPQVTFLPQYIIMARLGWINTYQAVIFPFVGTSMGLFLMKQFMEVMPMSLIEAARIDGASEFGICFRIIMPNVKPAWLTLAIFTFQSAWNTTGGSFIYDEELKMLPTAISQLVASNTIARMGVGMASTVFLMIPPILFFILSQSRIIQTMAHAGIKE